MKKIITIFLLLLTCLAMPAKRADVQPVSDLLDRIGGEGTSARFYLQLNNNSTTSPRGGKEGVAVVEWFEIKARKGKPCIEGNSIPALCVGVNWYLNHYAHVNIAWDMLTTDLTHIDLPLPTKSERHTANTQHRYYLNYCTFAYSMATWTWTRWQQEIDWMALHGINMPLQLVGLEAVWREFLINHYGYSEDEAEDFVPGPAFTAWWGMNNLEGWGGDGDDPMRGVHNNAWYERQAHLSQLICQRERELGMQPVLPGFCGMVPSNFNQKTGLSTERANLWCRFQRPAILDPTSDEFQRAARHYYDCLHRVMGTSRYYSMDPFHEGGTISSGRYSEGYRAIFDAMNTNCGSQSEWVIQQWQWEPYQATSLTAVPAGRLIVLDLFSDGRPAFDKYSGYAPQQAIYCTIPNFGGRTGFMGRLPSMAHNYFHYKNQYSNINGIGAAPEAIESVPVVYDLLFELPWMNEEPNLEEWISDYAISRTSCIHNSAFCIHNSAFQKAQEAWKIILKTAMNESTALQGPHEAVMCGRPSLTIDKVSSWGGSNIFYNQDSLVLATKLLLDYALSISSPRGGREGVSGSLLYDLTDLTRQILSDKSKSLLADINTAWQQGDSAMFNTKKDLFLELILDTDRLLGTNPLFRLGRWTDMARQSALEIQGADEHTIRWFEQTNALTLITTWGNREQSEQGGLRDYSYRQWQGMLRDYYYPRWHYFFNHCPGQLSTPADGWFSMEWQWAHTPHHYSPTPEGDTLTIVEELLNKWTE